MPLRVQWGLADVHGIGLGTWSLPEPMDLGRAHMDGTLTTHTHPHPPHPTHPWEGCTRHSTHRMHTTHTQCLHWHACMHTGTRAALALWLLSVTFQALARTDMARAGQGAAASQEVACAGHCCSALAIRQHLRGPCLTRVLFLSRPGCNSADFPLCTGYVADLRSALPTPPLR